MMVKVRKMSTNVISEIEIPDRISAEDDKIEQFSLLEDGGLVRYVLEPEENVFIAMEKTIMTTFPRLTEVTE